MDWSDSALSIARFFSYSGPRIASESHCFRILDRLEMAVTLLREWIHQPADSDCDE
jgi:hypothetical protein